MQPRWLGMESSDCAVALEPGFFAGRGDDERDRFLAGARRRGELALVVAVIGNASDDRPGSVLSQFDSSVHLSNVFTSVNGRRLPAGTRPAITQDLGSADRDLAMRLHQRGHQTLLSGLAEQGSREVIGEPGPAKAVLVA